MAGLGAQSSLVPRAGSQPWAWAAHARSHLLAFLPAAPGPGEGRQEGTAISAASG
jgi:hypothetical protein